MTPHAQLAFHRHLVIGTTRFGDNGLAHLFPTRHVENDTATVVFLGPDGGPPSPGSKRRLKVFLRTLLFSTSQRGQTVESVHVNLQRGESRQNFSIWVYGDDRLARGSGLFVGADGVACNHHFLLPNDGTNFLLLAGDYALRVFAKRVHDTVPIQLAEVRLSISDTQAVQLQDTHSGIYFDWGHDQQAYHSHVEKREPPPMPKWLFEAASQLVDESHS